MPTTTCSACGARLQPGAPECPVCGTPVDTPEEVFGDDPVAEETTPGPAPRAAAAPPSAQSCPNCGTANPPHARYCIQCGAALGVAQSTRAGTPGLGKRVALIVGVGLAIVIGLFAATQLSDPAPKETVAEASGGAAVLPEEPLPQDLIEPVTRLEAEIEASDDPVLKLGKQKELVELLARSEQFVKAAQAQQTLAQSTGTAGAWADVGSLYFAQMLRAAGAQQVAYAGKAATAYRTSLEIEPDNPDVRTDLAWALQYDQTNPMQAVEQLRSVLDDYPDHVQANFNFGLMLARIGRADKARAQFEKVLTLTEADSPVHARAQQELERI